MMLIASRLPEFIVRMSFGRIEPLESTRLAGGLDAGVGREREGDGLICCSFSRDNLWMSEWWKEVLGTTEACARLKGIQKLCRVRSAASTWFPACSQLNSLAGWRFTSELSYCVFTPSKRPSFSPTLPFRMGSELTRGPSFAWIPGLFGCQPSN